MSEDYDDLYLEDLEPLLRDVDVSERPGLFWYAVGTVAVFSMFIVTAVWRLVYRRK